jgi:hypothetical protein
MAGLVETTGHRLNKILIAGQWPRKFSRERADTRLPLHVKRVGRLDWNLAEQAVAEDLLATWRMARQSIEEPEKFLPQGYDAIGAEDLPEAAITEADLTALMEHGYVELLPAGATPKGACRVFTATEREKNRRRLIVEPLLNKALFLTGDVVLPTVEEIVAPTASTAGAVCLDFMAFYNQFLLPEESRDWYCFAFRGRRYRSRNVCTGQRQCPALAQALTASIARASVLGDSTAHAYIDNVRFCGSLADAVASADRFVELSRAIGITTNDSDGFLAEYTFLGVGFRHGDDASVELAEKTRAKLAAWGQTIQHPLDLMALTMRDVLGLFGVVVWGLRVLARPLAELYHLIKFLRRRSTRLLDEDADLWPSLAPEILRAIRLCGGDRRVRGVPTNDQDHVVFSDACPTGFGVVWCVPGGGVRIRSGRFARREHINVLELRALLAAVRWLPNFPALTRVKFWVDNTSAMHACRNGRSRNFRSNAISARIWSLLRDKNIAAELAYVPSAENLADAPSRLSIHASTALGDCGESAAPNAHPRFHSVERLCGQQLPCNSPSLALGEGEVAGESALRHHFCK